MIVKSRTIEWPDNGKYGAYMNGDGLGGWTCDKNRYPTLLDGFHTSRPLKALARFLPLYQGYEEFRSTSFKKPLWNECTHYKRTSTAKLHSVGWFTGTQIPGWACPGTTILSPAEDRIYRHFAEYYRMIKTYASGLESYILMDDPGTELIPDLSFSAEAWANFQPRFKGEVSLINSLFELKDFGDIAKILCKSVKSLFDELRGLGVTDVMSNLLLLQKSGIDIDVPPALRETPDVTTGLTKGVAGVWLTHSLAIRPILNDIRNYLKNLLQYTLDAYEKFKTDGEELHTVHFSKDFITSNTLKPYASVVSVSDCYYKGSLCYEKWTANMMRTYSCAPVSIHNIYMAYWGLRLDLPAIWNMLPWSFLLDYIIGIGKSLDLAQRDSNVDLNTIQYCESVLRSNENGIFVNPFMADIHYFEGGSALSSQYFKLKKGSIPRLVTGIQHSRFNRKLRVPYFGPALPKLKLPQGKQLATTAALVRCLF